MLDKNPDKFKQALKDYMKSKEIDCLQAKVKEREVLLFKLRIWISLSHTFVKIREMENKWSKKTKNLVKNNTIFAHLFADFY